MQSNDDALGAGRRMGGENAGLSRQALKVIEGERKAHEYLTRLRSQQADPDELALIVAMLYGASLRGFARVIEKALGGRDD